MAYTLSHKIGIIGTIFFGSESLNSSIVDPDKQQKSDILKATPELKDIAEKISLKELYARSRVISKLQEMVNNREQTFGKVKSVGNARGVDNAIENLKEVIGKLKSEQNITNLGNTSINAWFKGWDGPGDTNIAVVSGTNMKYRKFLSNVVNDSQLVASLFVSNEKAPESAESEVIRQRTRLSTFLIALENKNPENQYKNMFRNAHEAIAKGDLDGAKEIARKTVKKEWNIDINSVSDKSGHADALRAIGATHEAGQAVVGSAKELTEKKDKLNEKQNALVSELKARFNSEKQNSTAIATTKYEQLLTALPDSDPYKVQVIRGKSQIIEELASEKAYMNILDGYIAKNGSDGLGGLFDMYNDMKGLKGFWNFTDENAKMTKEMAIMVASFALTAGIGPILGGIGIGARAVAGATVLRSTVIANDANKFRQGLNMASNAGKAGVRIAAVGAARIAEGGIILDDAAKANKFARISAEATKFTTADALLRSAYRTEGERSGFDGFFGKLTTNTVMFGAFGGMEKFVSAPLLEKLATKYGIQNIAAKFVLGSTVLTGGDIVVMQALHAAETGTLEWNWMSAYQALAFRVGMKGTEKAILTLKEHFPNLSKKVEAMTKKSEKTPETKVLEPSSEPIARKKIDPVAQEYQKLESIFSDQLKSDIKKIPGLTVGIQKGGNYIQSTQGSKEKITLSDPNNPTVGISVDANNGIIYLKKQDGSHTTLQLESNGSGKFERTVYDSNSIATIESTSNDLDTNSSQESQKLVIINAERGLPHEPQKGDVLGNSVQPKRISSSESASPSNKEGPQKYIGEADKFIISKSNKADIKQFQKEGFDLSGIGFEGWNVKQTQKKGVSTFVLTHTEHGEYSFRTAKEVQEFLKPKDAPVTMSSGHENGSGSMGVAPQENGSRILVVPKQEQIRNYFNTFLRKELISGNSIPLDSIGLPGWSVKKLPKGNNSSDNVFELSIPGKDPIQVEGSGELQKRIQQEARKLLSGSVSSPSEGAKTDSRYDENGRLIDPQAKSRIENEHRMNTPLKSAQESAEILSSQSFRKEMDNLMSLDDATFQQRYIELQSRGNVRMYEREMYEVAVNVRKLSDAQIIEKAKGDIVENRQSLRDVSPQGEKARIVAENAALRYRLKNILKESGIDGPVTEPPTGPEAFKNFDKKWLLIPGILGLLLLLHKCQGGNEPAPLSSSPTVEEVYDACSSCYQGSKAVLNKTRKINGKEANDAYRLSVSQRWMQTQAWKDLEKNYTNNKTILPQNSDFTKAMDAILSKGGLTVENVQSLQHCIGMLDGNISQDSKESQDGMLGKITTRKIAEYISQCKITADATSV